MASHHHRTNRCGWVFVHCRRHLQALRLQAQLGSTAAASIGPGAACYTFDRTERLANSLAKLCTVADRLNGREGQQGGGAGVKIALFAGGWRRVRPCRDVISRCAAAAAPAQHHLCTALHCEACWHAPSPARPCVQAPTTALPTSIRLPVPLRYTACPFPAVLFCAVLCRVVGQVAAPLTVCTWSSRTCSLPRQWRAT